MLAFAALLPHPLISIPEIGKKETARVKKTVRALRVLAQELYAAKPDTLVVLTPHASPVADTYTINQQPVVRIDLSRYGDLVDRQEYKTDIGFGYRIKESVEHSIPVVLTAETILDYGSAVCLFHLTQHIPHNTLRVVIIGTHQGSGDYLALGRVINGHINRTTQRVALVATGDLLPGAARNPVTPYRPEAASYNKRIYDYLQRTDTQGMLSLTTTSSENPAPCILNPLCLLVSVLGERHYTFVPLSFETALGVGYCTALTQLS